MAALEVAILLLLNMRNRCFGTCDIRFWVCGGGCASSVEVRVDQGLGVNDAGRERHAAAASWNVRENQAVKGEVRRNPALDGAG